MSGQHPSTHAGAGRFWKPPEENASSPFRPRTLTRPLSNSVVSDVGSSSDRNPLRPAPFENNIGSSFDTGSAVCPKNFSNEYSHSRSTIDRCSSSASGSSSGSTHHTSRTGSVVSLPSELSYSFYNQALPSIPERMSLAQRILFDERQSKAAAYVRHLEKLEELRLSQERSLNEPARRISKSPLTPPDSARPESYVEGHRPRSGSGRSHGMRDTPEEGLKLDLGEEVSFQNLFRSTSRGAPEEQTINPQALPTSPVRPTPRRSSTHQSHEPQLHMEQPNYELPAENARDSENRHSKGSWSTEQSHELDQNLQRSSELHTPQIRRVGSPKSLGQAPSREEPPILRQTRSHSNLAVELDENAAPVLLGTVPPPQISLSYVRAPSFRLPPSPASIASELPSSGSSPRPRGSSQSQPPPPYSAHDWSRSTNATPAPQQPTSPSSNLPEPVRQPVPAPQQPTSPSANLPEAVHQPFTPPAPFQQPPPTPSPQTSTSSPPPVLPPRPPPANTFELSSSLSVLHKPRPRSAEQKPNRVRRYSNLAAYNTVPGDPFPIFPRKQPQTPTYPSFGSPPTEQRVVENKQTDEFRGRYLVTNEERRLRGNSIGAEPSQLTVSIEPDIDPRTGRQWVDSGVKVVR